MKNKVIYGIIVLLFLMYFVAQLQVYIFSGLIMFAGIVALTESCKPIRWFVAQTGNIIDIIIFGGSIFLLLDAGPTIAIGVSIAGLLFSYYYKPYLRERLSKSKNS